MEFLKAHIAELVGLLGALGVIFTAYVALCRLTLERHRTDLAYREISLQQEALSFSAFLEDWQHTSNELSALIRDTEVDRVMILRAWNGVLTPKWTTAVYQMRADGQEPRQYVHFELDSDYIDRLRRIVAGSALTFSVSELPESYVRQVYEAEGVKSSYWAHLRTDKAADSDSRAITYVSFSSHSREVLTTATQTRCMLMVGRLKGLAANFHEKHPG